MKSPDSNADTIIGIVGSGAMGAGIAQVALTAGLRVLLHDANQAALENARAQILARLKRLAEKGQLPADAPAQLIANLVLAPELSGLKPAQTVIEAIVEQIEAKQKLFTELEAIVSPDAVLATNTSSLQVAAIARICKHRERICGMHFFNPVPLMQLVEIVGAPETSESTIGRATALGKALGKTAVLVKDVPGFLVNLAGRAYATEALHIQHEGVAEVAVIDRIMRDAAGFRMGPFELMDLTGIDVNFPATRYIYEGFQHDPRLKTTLLHESLFKAGRLGRKTGQGFHLYGADGAAVNPGGGGEEESSPVSEYRISLGQDGPELKTLAEQVFSITSLEDPNSDILVSPVGEDASSVAARLRLDPRRTVGIDFVGVSRQFLTVMGALGAHQRALRLAAYLRTRGFRVAVIRDSPGFVAPRILSMIANLGCEIAQMGIGVPEDIDTAMRLAQNYPRGPLEWAAFLGLERTLETLERLQAITGSDRYRPSLWLRRRASLGLPVHFRD